MLINFGRFFFFAFLNIFQALTYLSFLVANRFLGNDGSSCDDDDDDDYRTETEEESEEEFQQPSRIISSPPQKRKGFLALSVFPLSPFKNEKQFVLFLI